jgi:hypothetical protein
MGKVVISGASTTVLGTTTTAISINGGPVSGLTPSNTLQLDYAGLGATSVNRLNVHAITMNGGSLLLTANTGSITAQNESLGANRLTIADNRLSELAGWNDQGLSELLRDMRDAGPELAQALIAYCREHLSPIKCPKSVDFEAELPRHPTGKLYKRLLKDRYWAGHASKIV